MCPCHDCPDNRILDISSSIRECCEVVGIGFCYTLRYWDEDWRSRSRRRDHWRADESRSWDTIGRSRSCTCSICRECTCSSDDIVIDSIEVGILDEYHHSPLRSTCESCECLTDRVSSTSRSHTHTWDIRCRDIVTRTDISVLRRYLDRHTTRETDDD